MQTTTLTPKQINNLLNLVDNTELYNSVITFIDSIKGVGKFPYPLEEFQKITDEAIQEALEGKGKPISLLRK